MSAASRREATVSPKGLRRWRLRKGWTQEYAALAAGVDARSWRRWENGERAPPRMLGRWMRAVDIILEHGLRPSSAPPPNNEVDNGEENEE